MKLKDVSAFFLLYTLHTLVVGHGREGGGGGGGGRAGGRERYVPLLKNEGEILAVCSED